MSTILVSPKTNVPYSMTDTVKRARLYDSFRNNTLKKVTILRAPAGYGKTTALSSWLEQTKEKVAWLSIDNADNDLIRFWTYIFHAVDAACDTDLHKELTPLFQVQDTATFEFVLDSFLHELSSIEEYVHIVLDDYHLIDNSMIHEMMTRFIEQLPQHVHVYLTTRTALPLPIAKWHVKQWVHEFNTLELCFTYQEAKQFYATKNLPIDHPNTLQLIMEQTEGWVAGLQLASLTFQPDALQQWKAQTQPIVSEFSWQEIIMALPMDSQYFLIRTSLLNELDPTICNSITQRTNSFELLEEFERMGLFIVRLQSVKPVFRYHHLFAEALQIEFRRRFSAQQITAFTLETATLLHDKGDYIAAIELVLHYDLFEQAKLWITEHLVELYLSGQTATFMRFLLHLRDRHYTVPYEMLVMGTITSISTAKLDVASALMQELEMRQQTEQWMDQEENAAMADIYAKVKAYAIIAAGGDLLIVKEIMEKRLTIGPVPSRWDLVPMQYNSFEYKLLRTSVGSKGKLPITEEAVTISNFLRDPKFQSNNLIAFTYGISAESLYERNFIELAKQELEIAIKYGHQYNDSGLFVPMYLLKAKIYILEKQPKSALTMLSQVMETVKEKHWLNTLRTMKAYCYVIAGDSRNAETELLGTKTTQPLWMLVHARLLLLKKMAEDALPIVIKVKTKAQQDQQIATLVEATVLEAICHYRIGNHAAALAVLHEALEQGAPYYYIRTFLDEEEILPLLNSYLQQLLEDDAKRRKLSPHYLQSLQVTSLGNAKLEKLLTLQEKKIYDLLCNGFTNQQIAVQLDLSVGTIRVYLSAIYRKLGVNSRAKALLLRKQ